MKAGLGNSKNTNLANAWEWHFFIEADDCNQWYLSSLPKTLTSQHCMEVCLDPGQSFRVPFKNSYNFRICLFGQANVFG